ncbi:MAG: hypothetical protein R2851_14300 [Caldilineaceae bacterium]
MRDAYVKVDALAEFLGPRHRGRHGHGQRCAGRSHGCVTTPIYDNDGLVLVEHGDGDATAGPGRDWLGGATDTVTRSFVYVRDGTGRGLDQVVDGVTWSAVAAVTARPQAD